MGHLHPVIDFPVYGLDSSWTGPRWLTFVQGQREQPVREVHLQHGWSRGVTPDRPWVVVISVPWPQFAQVMGHSGDAPEHTLAWYGLENLVGMTMPALPLPRVRKLRRMIDPVIEERAAHFADWPVASLIVDGAPVAARTSGWAGAWTAFVCDLPEAACIIAASGIPPGELSLTTLTDGSGYHFDLHSPVDFPDTLIASAEAALGPDPSPDGDGPQWPLHADLAALLNR